MIESTEVPPPTRSPRERTESPMRDGVETVSTVGDEVRIQRTRLHRQTVPLSFASPPTAGRSASSTAARPAVA